MLSGLHATERLRREVKNAPPEIIHDFVALGLKRSFAAIDTESAVQSSASLSLSETVFKFKYP
jgi:hypothetical protein